MNPRKAADTAAKGLRSAQEQLGSTIEHYLSDYANQLLWEDQHEFITLKKPALPERLRPTQLLRLQTEGWKGLIPDETLEALTCDTYILIGEHLFYVEKARHKITEIPLTAEQLQKVNQAVESDTFLDKVEEITGYHARRETVREIKESDPLQIQFSKHAMLALQETEELVQNLGKLAEGLIEFTKTEPAPTEDKTESKNLTEQIGKILVSATATDAVDRALQSLQAPSTDEPGGPTSLVKESGKLALEMTSSAIDKVPGLRRIIKLTKPLHQTLVLSYLAPLSAPVAFYQMYVTNRWYLETASSVKKAYPAVTDFIREQRDGILRPWQRLSEHCEALHKIAQQAELPREAVTQLETLRKTLAELQAQVLLNPGQSQELLSSHVVKMSQTLATLTSTYFTTDPTLTIPAKSAEDKTPTFINLHTIFQQFVEGTKTVALDTEQSDLIKKTKAVLADAKLDKEGYYSYLDNGETAVSQNLKAIANVYRGIELLREGYASADPAEQRNAILHAQKTLDHLLKIDWEQTDDSLDEHYQTLLDTLLSHSMKTAGPKLEQIADASHEFELAHHLRYGSILEGVRPLFDKLESLCHERGLVSARNPLGHKKEHTEKLKAKLEKAVIEEKETKSEQMALEKTLDQLIKYEMQGDNFTKYDSAWRKLGYKKQKFGSASVEKYEETVENLLLELVTIQAKGIFKPEDLEAVSLLEDRLISDLPFMKKKDLSKAVRERPDKNEHLENLQKKLVKAIGVEAQKSAASSKQSYYSQTTTLVSKLRKESEQHRKDKRDKTWPPQELLRVIEAVEKRKQQLEAQALDVTKYTEALAHQEKMRTDYALAILKKDGLVTLLDAVKAGQSDPKINVRQKRKLAILLADFGHGTREENLVNAHKVTTAFITEIRQRKTFIENICKLNPTLGHTLAVEAMLGGYDTGTPETLKSNDHAVIQQDIINTLDRLDPSHVLDIIKGMAAKSPRKEIRERAALLIELLDKSPAPAIRLDEEHIQDNLNYLNSFNEKPAEGFTQDALVSLIAQSYRKYGPSSNPEIPQKLGLFLARLANADPMLAKNIFDYQGKDENIGRKYKQAQAIIRAACLADRNPSNRKLYYDALISSLTFSSHKNIKSYEILLMTNRAAILALHKESLIITEKDQLNEDKVIDHYRKNPDALGDLIEKYITDNVSPGSKSEKQLNDFYEALLRCQAKPSLTAAHATKTLQNARLHLEQTIKHLFSDHANKHYLWQEEKEHEIKPILTTDPLSVKISKHGVLALKEAEDIGIKIDQFMLDWQSSKKKFKVTTKHAPEITQSILRLSQHIQEISILAKESGASEATLKQLNALKQSIAALPKQLLSNPGHAQTVLDTPFQQMGQVLTDLARPYASLSRPSAPSEPERKYTTAILEPYNPTAQARAEWFPLIEPLRSAMTGSQNLHEFFAQFVEDAKSRGAIPDPAEEKLILETLAALERARIDGQGYYLYDEKETPFSQSLKGLFNLSWGINELSRGFWEHSGALASFTATAQAGQHAAPLWGHFWKIKWPALGGQFGMLSNQLMNAMLIYGKDRAFPPLEELAKASHDAELKHDLRMGVVSEPVRPIFDSLEQLFIARALGTSANPFGYDPALEADLQQKLQKANEDKDEGAIAKYTDAIQQYQKIRQESALRCLHKEGLIALIEAAKQGTKEEHTNIEHKRRLAILLADIDLTSREEALAKAHQIATVFAQDSNQIEALIKAVKKLDAALAHTLAIEARLAGHALFKVNDPLLHHDDKQTAQKNLVRALERLEAKQVLALLEPKNITSLAIFLALLKGDTLSEAAILKHTPDSAGSFNKEDLVNELMERYKASDESIIKNKLGLFLARLARTDSRIAQLVFADQQAREILKSATADDPALYHESLANSFQYSYIEKHHKNENRSASDFIEANQSVILEMHKTLHPDDKEDAETIKKYQTDPFSLLQLVEKFTKDKTSAGSDAEKRLSEFASAFMLCPDNTEIRQHLLELQQGAKGSKFVEFLELLTPEASIPFWKQVKQDLIERPAAVLVMSLESKLETIENRILHLSEKDQKQLKEKATAFVKAQKLKLQSIEEALEKSEETPFFKQLPGGKFIKGLLIETQKDHILSCRHAAQEMGVAQQNIDQEFKQLSAEIDILTVDQALSGEKAELAALERKLKAIEKILADYAENRSSKLASSLRTSKIKLANEYKDKFSRLRQEVREASQATEEKGTASQKPYVHFAKSAIELFEAMEISHAQLLKSTQVSKQEGHNLTYSRLSGKLGRAMQKIDDQVNKNSSTQPESTDQHISSIGKIIQSIRATLAKYKRKLFSFSEAPKSQATSVRSLPTFGRSFTKATKNRHDKKHHPTKGMTTRRNAT